MTATHMFSAGLFQRACQKLSDDRAQHDLADELGGLKGALMERLSGIANNLTDERHIIDGNLWLGQDEAEAVASQLAPKLEKSRGDIEAMLFEVVTLEVRCQLPYMHSSCMQPDSPFQPSQGPLFACTFCVPSCIPFWNLSSMSDCSSPQEGQPGFIFPTCLA